MNSDWQLCIPHIGPDWNLRECLSSMGEITVPTLIIDNSPTSDTKSMSLPKGIEVVCYPKNAGISKSFNLGLEKNAKWTVIMSVSMRFGKGLADFIRQSKEHASEYGLNYHIGMHIYTIGCTTVDVIGKFDENLWPGWYADNDWWRRLIVSGIKIPVYHPTDVSCIGDAISLKHGFVNYDLKDNQAYYESKWGALPPDDFYTHPFNDPTKTLSYCP